VQANTIKENWLSYNTASQVAQSVQCLATGWTTGRSRFDPRQRWKAFSCNLCVQTSSRAHPDSCTMGTGVLSPGVKRGRGVTLITHLHLVPRLRMSRSYTSCPPSAFVACTGTAFYITQIYKLSCKILAQFQNFATCEPSVCPSVLQYSEWTRFD
jgi:hypothetical protein